MVFAVLQYLHLFQRYSSLLLSKLELDDVIKSNSVETYHKMKNISEKSELRCLKLGTNVESEERIWKTQDEKYRVVAMTTFLARASFSFEPNITICDLSQTYTMPTLCLVSLLAIKEWMMFVEYNKGKCHSRKKETWKLSCCHYWRQVSFPKPQNYFQRYSWCQCYLSPRYNLRMVWSVIFF